MPRTATSDLASKLVGEAIRAARLEVGITQAELASRLGTTPVYITNVEAGRTNLTVGQLANIADALGAGLDVQLPLLATAPIKITA
jgi:transcriptional regulator with XRE-family HTH domain